MNKYKCTFRGRKVNAIGIFYKIAIFIEANNIEEVNEKLYEKYEHISELKITL